MLAFARADKAAVPAKGPSVRSCRNGLARAVPLPHPLRILQGPAGRPGPPRGAGARISQSPQEERARAGSPPPFLYSIIVLKGGFSPTRRLLSTPECAPPKKTAGGGCMLVGYAQRTALE